MKKVSIILVLFLFLTGCNNQDNKIIDSNVSATYFGISENYKKGVAGFYVANNLDHRIDTKEMELGLMDISSTYLSPNRVYYQTGQYLKKNDLATMVSELNAKPIKVGQQTLVLPVISYIYETNYVSSGGDLKAVALGIAINTYQNIDGQIVALTNQQIKDFIIQNNNIVIKKMRDKKEIDRRLIVMGIFKMAKADDFTPGSFIAKGSTNSDQIKTFKDIESYQLMMNNDAVKNIDEVNYKNYVTLETTLRNKYNNLLISGIGSFRDKTLISLDIKINVGAVSVTSVMAIGEDIVGQVNRLFEGKNIKVIIKNDNQDQAFVIFNDKNKNGNIYLLP